MTLDFDRLMVQGSRESLQDLLIEGLVLKEEVDRFDGWEEHWNVVDGEISDQLESDRCHLMSKLFNHKHFLVRMNVDEYSQYLHELNRALRIVKTEVFSELPLAVD